MTPNVLPSDPIDVFVSPFGYPHVLHTSRPLGLREDHKEAYQTLVNVIRNERASLDDVRAWFLGAAQRGAITRLHICTGSDRFVFPLLLSLNFVRVPTMGAHELRFVEGASAHGIAQL